jgi:hypothetical protein
MSNAISLPSTMAIARAVSSALARGYLIVNVRSLLISGIIMETGAHLMGMRSRQQLLRVFGNPRTTAPAVVINYKRLTQRRAVELVARRSCC